MLRRYAEGGEVEEGWRTTERPHEMTLRQRGNTFNLFNQIAGREGLSSETIQAAAAAKGQHVRD